MGPSTGHALVATWLDLGITAEHLAQALPAGSLAVEQLRPGSDG
ncbi:hypothetical protein [uncultured Enterovirga sp.]